MRILLATPLYPPEIGGPATDCASLERELLRRDIEVVVVPFSTVRRFPPGVRHLLYWYRLMRAARGARCIVAFDTFSVGLPAALLARLMRLPLIVRVPGDYAWEQGVQRFGVIDSIDVFQTKSCGFRIEFLRTCQRFVVRTAKLVVTPSDYFKRVVLGWGARPASVTRIYLGLDMATEGVTLPIGRPDGNVLFSAGRLVPWKGFRLILELLVMLPEWKAVVAGNGPLYESLQGQARSLGVADRVEFTGALPHGEVLGWCATADAFVLNTSFESFSFQILEAMAVGASVITTNVGSLPELITSGVEGVLCDPYDTEAFLDAVQSIEEEPEMWQERRAAARAKAAQFSLKASGSAFAEAIHHICI